jgi:hypothetical protein
MNARCTLLALALAEDDEDAPDEDDDEPLLPQPASAVTTLVSPAISRMAGAR